MTEMLLDAVSSRNNFGYTIGASSQVLRMISAIRRLSDRISQGEVPEDLCQQIQKRISDLTVQSDGSDLDTAELERVWDAMSKNDQLEHLHRLHLRLFRTSAIIYLYRTLLNVPPKAVGRYVAEALHDTTTFLRLRGGAVSMWPVFIAAVEATEAADQQRVRQWFQISGRTGLDNRKTARKIIQAVWNERSQLAMMSGLEPSQVVVDWRQIQQGLGVDILLL